jgi:hypothetical protein
MIEVLDWMKNNIFWIITILWNLPWKAVALWNAARRKELGWFILIFIVQTYAILEIIYLFWVIKENKRRYTGVRKWWKRRKKKK